MLALERHLRPRMTMSSWTLSPPKPSATRSCAGGSPSTLRDAEGAAAINRAGITKHLTNGGLTSPSAHSDGMTYDRWTAFKLVDGTCNMPGTRRFALLADNIDFRRRLRQAHPATETTCLQRRNECIQARCERASLPPISDWRQGSCPIMKLLPRYLLVLTSVILLQPYRLASKTRAGGDSAKQMRIPAVLAQTAELELSAGNYDAALKHYELVKSWSPAVAEAAIHRCLAAGAFPTVNAMQRFSMRSDSEVSI